MTLTIIPCTTLQDDTWGHFTLARVDEVKDGAVVPTFGGGFTISKSVFQGDEKGVPLSRISQAGANQTGVPFDPAVDLAEVVTRADGTQLTTLALLNTILTAKMEKAVAAAVAAAVPAP